MSGNPQELPKGIGCSLTLLFIAAVWFAIEFITSTIHWATKSFLNSFTLGLSTLILVYVATNIYKFYKKGKIKSIYLRSIIIIKKKLLKINNSLPIRGDYIKINTKTLLTSIVIITIISLPIIGVLFGEDKGDIKEKQVERHKKLNNRGIDYSFRSLSEFENKFRNDNECPTLSIGWRNCKYIPSTIKVKGTITEIDRKKEDCGGLLTVCQDEGMMKTENGFFLDLRFAFNRYFKLYGQYDKKEATVICRLYAEALYNQETKDISINTKSCSIM